MNSPVCQLILALIFCLESEGLIVLWHRAHSKKRVIGQGAVPPYCINVIQSSFHALEKPQKEFEVL